MKSIQNYNKYSQSREVTEQQQSLHHNNNLSKELKAKWFKQDKKKWNEEMKWPCLGWARNRVEEHEVAKCNRKASQVKVILSATENVLKV